MLKILIWCCVLIFGKINGQEDIPCAVRDVGIEGRSIVCVCNATYCDTISRVAPEAGTYVVYTSTLDGKRFEKSYGQVELSDSTIRTSDIPQNAKITTNLEGTEEAKASIPPKDELRTMASSRNTTFDPDVVLRVYTNSRYQYIEGFGGSVTDAASINWKSLSDTTQTRLIDTYFGSEGIEYNMIRVPIGGCDFSDHVYTLQDYPQYDATLSNFSITDEDLFYKLPMIRRSQEVATDEVKIIASTWSPPVWMKTNENIRGFGQLKPEYYQTYADYHIRFMEEYEKAEVKIWALTTTNEPLNGIIPAAEFNSLGWWPGDLARYLVNNLGPTLRNSKFNETLILGIDDQRYMLPVYLLGMEATDPASIDVLDGIAVHYYGNFFPAGTLSWVHNRYENKIIIATEACEGPMPWDAARLEFGSWERGEKYTRYILQDLNNFVAGWLDWNLCLDENGGPNWAENFVDSPILVNAEQDEFYKQPMFYAMGHFSKFIPRGSRRLLIARRTLFRSIENTVLLTPAGNIVLVLLNRQNTQVDVQIILSTNTFINISMEPRAIKTIEINPN